MRGESILKNDAIVNSKKKHSKTTSKYVYLLALIPFAIVVCLYELIPLIMLVIDSFGVDGDASVLFSLENYKKIFTSLAYQKSITNSLKITTVSTLVGIFLAFLGKAGLPA